MRDTEAEPQELQAPVPPGSRLADGLALAVLLGSLLLVVLYARSALDRERRLAEAHLAEEAGQIVEYLSQRLLAYDLSARGGASLFASVEQPSARQWRAYVDGLQMGRRAGAAGTLGYAAFLAPDDLRDLQLEQRAGGEGLFSVYPRGVRAHYGPVVYLEPRRPETMGEVGFDMLSEPERRAAMEAARDSGETRLSGRLRLRRQFDASPEGMILYTPVYRGGVVPTTVAARREALSGWIFVPVRLGDFVPGALSSLPRTLSLRITDVTGPAPRRLYADPDFEAVAADAMRTRHSVRQPYYGREWEIDFVARDAAAGASPLRTTVLVGLIAALLLSAAVWSLARTGLHAQRLAERLSDSYRRSERRFRSAMVHSPIGKALLDSGDRVVDANPALAHIAGLPLEQLIGMQLCRLFVDGRAASEVDREEADAHVRDGIYRATRILRRSDGSRRRVRLFSAPVPGDLGSDVVKLVQLDDVTDWYRAEERVRALNRTLEARVTARTRELERANRELEAFSYSVSHDLRAPLRTIDGFSRLLDERYSGAFDDTGRDYLARIRAAAGRMDTLIDALLHMARLSRAEVRRQPLDLSAMARQMAAELRQAEPGRDVEIAVEEGLRAHGDPALVGDLLQNLIGNAWKFTGGRGGARIEIGGERRGDVPAFFVRDNGAGFSQQYAAKLFRPFQRLHSQEEFPGHGIGLASVRRIVESHGGEIWAEGRPGDGACFWFTLPDPPAEG